jgi:hypothetical protein
MKKLFAALFQMTDKNYIQAMHIYDHFLLCPVVIENDTVHMGLILGSKMIDNKKQKIRVVLHGEMQVASSKIFFSSIFYNLTEIPNNILFNKYKIKNETINFSNYRINILLLLIGFFPIPSTILWEILTDLIDHENKDNKMKIDVDSELQKYFDLRKKENYSSYTEIINCSCSVEKLQTCLEHIIISGKEYDYYFGIMKTITGILWNKLKSKRNEKFKELYLCMIVIGYYKFIESEKNLEINDYFNKHIEEKEFDTLVSDTINVIKDEKETEKIYNYIKNKKNKIENKFVCYPIINHNTRPCGEIPVIPFFSFDSIFDNTMDDGDNNVWRGCVKYLENEYPDSEVIKYSLDNEITKTIIPLKDATMNFYSNQNNFQTENLENIEDEKEKENIEDKNEDENYFENLEKNINCNTSELYVPLNPVCIPSSLLISEKNPDPKICSFYNKYKEMVEKRSNENNKEFFKELLKIKKISKDQIKTIKKKMNYYLRNSTDNFDEDDENEERIINDGTENENGEDKNEDLENKKKRKREQEKKRKK